MDFSFEKFEVEFGFKVENDMVVVNWKVMKVDISLDLNKRYILGLFHLSISSMGNISIYGPRLSVFRNYRYRSKANFIVVTKEKLGDHPNIYIQCFRIENENMEKETIESKHEHSICTAK